VYRSESQAACAVTLVVTRRAAMGREPMSRARPNETTAAELAEFLTADDERQLAEAGVSTTELARQLELFQNGCPPIRLARPCRLGDGIRQLDDVSAGRLGAEFAAASRAGRVTHFVPASGAASRMFKSLFVVYERYPVIDDACLARIAEQPGPEEADLLRFLAEIGSFAFVDDLRARMRSDGLDLDLILAGGDRRRILEYLLTDRGLDYADRPKGLIPFHHYTNDNRTAIEEHLAEAGQCGTADGPDRVRVHFTVSPQYRHLIERHLQAGEVAARQVDAIDLELSVQSPATNTVAVDSRNRPLRDSQERLILRPGGHGALLANLAELHGDLVFIKNIDNIVPDDQRAETRRYKQLLGGYLIELQQRIFAHRRRLDAGNVTPADLAALQQFVEEELGLCPPPWVAEAPDAERQLYLQRILGRPLRVCGMVRNQGEPGGGPFWVRESDGTVALQIVESSQVDQEDADQREIFRSATHFNPVFIFCGMRDYRGQPFELSRHVDPQACFISTKSQGGDVLKALELPGLWNGAMAYWNTVFIEVPEGVFSPVKTVLDLLRPEHRPGSES